MIRLALRVPREQAEVVLAELLAFAPSGVEELAIGEDLVEYAVYGAAGELPALPDLQAAAGGALVEVHTSEIADDWSERWKRFHRPITIAAPAPHLPSLRVRPPWEPRADSESGAGGKAIEEIVLDPGQAFGTGAHDTTRLCLELLLALAAHDERRGMVVDLGTGSGVLAIAAARLGFAPVLALDHDPASVQAARDNAAANGVAIEVRRFDLRRESLPDVLDGKNDGEDAATGAAQPLLLANLVRPLLLELAEGLERAPTQLIASGLLRAEADEVAQAFAQRLGMCEHERRHGGEWAALWLLSRPESR